MTVETVKSGMFDGEIDAGVALLDKEIGPEWVFRVNLLAFDIRSPCRCVIGQVMGDYDAGINQLALEDEEDVIAGERLGFTLNSWSFSEGWDLLDEEWVERLTQLQKERTR